MISSTTFSRVAWAIAILIGCTIPASTSRADEARSAAAIEQLRSDIKVKSAAEIEASEIAVTPLTRADAAIARGLLFDAHRARLRQERAAELQAGKLRDGDLEMPFVIREFGKEPVGGHSICISVLGGGGAPKQVNDGQWENQKRLYSLEEGLYVVPRAPTDNWNLWHESHIDRLFSRLIEDLVVVRNADPDRVYVMGYSAGGDGVYQLAPRMADYWAAAAMMAGHPNDASPLGLRNVPFALQVGGKDAAYHRNAVAAQWGQQLDMLQQQDPDGYSHFVKIYENKGHWMGLEDKVALPWMAIFSRNPVPRRVVWKQSTVTHNSLYWLAVPAGTAKAGTLVSAIVRSQTIDLTEVEGLTSLLVRVDDRLLDLDQTLTITHRGRVVFEGTAPRTIATLQRTLAGRGDRNLMFAAEIAIDLPE